MDPMDTETHSQNKSQKPLASENLKVNSNIPATDSELVQDKPFSFKAGTIDCLINPLCLRDYLYLEEVSHDSLYLTVFWKLKDDKELAKLFQMDLSTVKRAKNLAKIASKLIEPIPLTTKLKAILNHNKHYKTQPRRWIITLKGFFEAHIPMEDLKNLLIYLAKYSAQKKTELLQIIQQGLGGVTLGKEENESETSSTYIEPDF